MATDTTALRNEIKRLVSDEKAALLDESPLRLLVRLIDSYGGSRVRLKQIVVLASEVRATEKLDERDLPGPDAVLKPLIIDAVKQAAGELMDDLFAGRSILPV